MLPSTASCGTPSSSARVASDHGPVAFAEQRGAHAPVAPVLDRRQRDVVAGDRPRLVRRDHVGEREPHVVGAGVPVLRAAGEPVAPERRLLAQHAGRREAACAPDVAEERERVVEREPRAQRPAREPLPGVERPGEAQRADEVRREREERAPLAARLEDEVQVAVLEVAHAAVHQPARARAGAARPVVALDERDPEPAHRRVARHPRPGDPAPHHEHVHARVAEGGERVGAPGEAHGAGHGAGVSPAARAVATPGRAGHAPR